KACRRTTGGTGPQPRAVARRTRAAEHGEHGEDPPFPRRPPPGLEGASDRGGDARTVVRALFRRARGPSWLRTAPAAPLPCRQRIVPDDTIETRCSAATTGPRDVVAVGSRTNAAAFAPHADCRWRLRPLTGRRATSSMRRGVDSCYDVREFRRRPCAPSRCQA